MPEYKVSVNVSIDAYEQPYKPSLESSHHYFIIEAADAAGAARLARQNLRIDGNVMKTVDAHERALQAAKQGEQ